MLRFLVALFLFLFCLPVPYSEAASRFWVGGGSSGNVNATAPTNWSATNGGAGNASVPTSADDVSFTSLSGSGTATLSANATWKSVTWAGYTGTFAYSTNALAIGDGVNNSTIVYGAATVYTFNIGSSQLTLTSPKSYTLTSNGNAGGSGILFSGATLTLKDDLTTSDDLFGNTGTLDASDAGANHNLTARSLAFNNTTTWTMGNGTATFTGSGGLFVAAGTTVTPGSSTIKLTANSPSFSGAGKTYNNLWFSTGGTGTLAITGNNTFNDFRDDGGTAHTIQFPSGGTQTVTTFSVNGVSGSLISLISDSGGTAATLSKASGTVSASFLSIKDSTATGGATWNCTNSCTNVSGNSGWNFTAPGPGTAARATLLGVGK